MSARRPSSRAKAYSFLLINTLLWGFASPIVKNAFSLVDPAPFLLFRYVVAFLVFLPIYFLYFRPDSISNKSNPKLLLSLALLGTPLTLAPLYWGLELTTSFHTSVLVAVSPLFTILGGITFLKEKLNPKEKGGLLISLLGTTILIISASASAHFSLEILAGNGLILLSNIIWASFLLLSKRYHLEPGRLSLTSYLVSIPFFLILTLIDLPNLNFQHLLQPSSYLAIIYMAIFGSVAGFLLYISGQKQIEASEAATFTYLQPLFALPLSYFWLHEPITPLLALSLIVIAGGVYISEMR